MVRQDIEERGRNRWASILAAPLLLALGGALGFTFRVGGTEAMLKSKVSEIERRLTLVEADRNAVSDIKAVLAGQAADFRNLKETLERHMNGVK